MEGAYLSLLPIIPVPMLLLLRGVGAGRNWLGLLPKYDHMTLAWSAVMPLMPNP